MIPKETKDKAIAMLKESWNFKEGLMIIKADNDCIDIYPKNSNMVGSELKDIIKICEELGIFFYVSNGLEDKIHTHLF